MKILRSVLAIQQADVAVEVVPRRRFLELDVEHAEAVEHVSLELGQFPDLMQFYADEVMARGRRLVSGIIARGVERGEFRDVDPQLAARMFSSIWMSHSTWCARREFFKTLGSDEQVLEEMLEFYLYALRP